MIGYLQLEAERARRHKALCALNEADYFLPARVLIFESIVLRDRSENEITTPKPSGSLRKTTKRGQA